MSKRIKDLIDGVYDADGVQQERKAAQARDRLTELRKRAFGFEPASE